MDSLGIAAVGEDAETAQQSTHYGGGRESRQNHHRVKGTRGSNGKDCGAV